MNQDICDLAAQLARRELTSVELVQAALNRISVTDSVLNAFVVTDPTGALQQARDIDCRRDKGEEMPALSGIPFAAKDNFLTRDLPTTACSKVRLPDAPAQDAAAVAGLRKAGMILLGKTNMHEWAYGATNATSAYGPTRNPWNTAHVTGGSSGGSGAALAAGQIPAALGSDTGGSARIPAAACGVCALKPSRDAVSKAGVLPLSWSLDSVGLMARSVRDLQLLWQACAHHGARASEKTGRPRLRLGLLKGPRFALAEAIAVPFDAALTELRAEMSSVEIEGIEAAHAAWRIILRAEATAWHVPLLQSQAGLYSDEVRAKLEAGRHISAGAYIAALRHREQFRHTLAQSLAGVDALVFATLPLTAPAFGQDHVRLPGGDMATADALMHTAWIANLSGFPALSIPCGFGPDGLPLGLTLLGRMGSDVSLMTIAERFQTGTDWHRRSPDGFGARDEVKNADLPGNRIGG